ncbi:alpha/beta hydrolase [Streptomyces sp. NPDC001389]|uniref:alpha/beta hydrolase n=1 Tax=Streptomyces sp. NPDC001389 TaxID=3364569 RepID=UPI0036813CD6
MGRFGRTIVTAAPAVAVVAGTAGWAPGDGQRPVTGPPPGAAAWRADTVSGRPLPDPADADPFDPRGRGRVAEVFGDLEGAAHVAVVVPGSGNDAPSRDAPRRPDTGPAGMARARVWAARGPSGWIADVPNLEVAGIGHGPAPASPAFGARRVPSSDVVGHTGYFAPGTRSPAAFAAITKGEVR